jgi:hypothetical protein
MSLCLVCSKERSNFTMNNKRVCMRCDELLFDLEAECEEESTTGPKTTRTLEFVPKTLTGVKSR